MLYLALGIGAAGILLGGFEIRQPMLSENAKDLLSPLSSLKKADVPVTSMLFPFLFVTIACGACSGFHGLICGGTTSKQIARESHCKPIGFGAMLLEGFVAVIALATVMMLAPADAARSNPARIYGDGLASFLGVFLGGGAFLFCATFGAMAFSTFVFDTLDVSTRLGRYLVQELFGASGRAAGVIGAALTAGTPLAILLSTSPDGWRVFWTLFGTSNQLLAALTLLGVTLWLRRIGKRYWYTLLPMVFVMAVTLTALALQIWLGVRDASAGAWRVTKGGATSLNPTILNAPVALALLALAGVFIVEALRTVTRRGGRPAGGGSGGSPR